MSTTAAHVDGHQGSSTRASALARSHGALTVAAASGDGGSPHCVDATSAGNVCGVSPPYVDLVGDGSLLLSGDDILGWNAGPHRYRFGLTRERAEIVVCEDTEVHLGAAPPREDRIPFCGEGAAVAGESLDQPTQIGGLGIRALASHVAIHFVAVEGYLGPIEVLVDTTVAPLTVSFHVPGVVVTLVSRGSNHLYIDTTTVDAFSVSAQGAITIVGPLNATGATSFQAGVD